MRRRILSSIPPRARTGLALMAAGALVLSGCGSASSVHVDEAKVGSPERGGTLRLALDSNPTCVDFQQAATNVALNVGRQMTDSLTDLDPKTGKLVPWLATSWTASSDSRQFTFRLRRGVTFQDGQPFTSTAVARNFREIQKLGAKATLAGSYLRGLRSISTPDAHTVTVRFSQPNAQFLNATSSISLGFYSPKSLDHSTPEQRCTQGQATTGPFRLQEFVPGQGAKLRRNDSYRWPSSLASHSGPAYLDALDFEIVPEATVRNGSLSSGQIDVDTQVLPQDEELLQHSEFSIHSRANPGLVYGLFPNTKDPILSDERVRQALNAAVDRPQLKALLSRYQSSADSSLARTTPSHPDHSKLLAHDARRARTLLDEAGWKKNSSTGIREKNGKKLEITIDYFQTAPFLELLQQQLRAEGIVLNLHKASIGEVDAKNTSGDYQAAFFNSTRSDPDVLRTIFSQNGARNVNQRSRTEKVDRLLDESNTELDAKRRSALVEQADTELIRHGYVIPLVELSGVMATAPKVRGSQFEASSRIQLYDTWKVGGTSS